MDSAAARGRGAGGWREGPQEERDRLRLERRHRGRLDGARLLAGGGARLIVVVGGSASRRRRCCWSSFVPMFCIAAAFYYMNRADPDCGTTFSWVTRAMGP